MDKEVFKDVKGWENFYQITSYGRVISIKKENPIEVCPHKEKHRIHPRVDLKNNNYRIKKYIYELVIEAFFPEKQKPYIFIHKDGNVFNNHINNIKFTNPICLKGEVWRDISGFENLYQVSNLGRIKALPTIGFNRGLSTQERILKPGTNHKGYLFVSLQKNNSKTTKSLHRLVALMFIPNPNNLPQVNHKDGIKLNNKIENLEWISNLDNMHHGVKMGLFLNRPSSKLTPQLVKQMRQEFKNGFLNTTQLAQKYNISQSHASNILNNKMWKLEYNI